MAVGIGRTRASISTEGFNEAIENLQAVGPILRAQVLERALKSSARIVQRKAKSLVTQPGYPGDKTKRKTYLTPLRDTIKVKLKQYPRVWVAVVGPDWNSGGQHGHNVEFGHQGRFPAEEHPYMRPAIEATRGRIESKFRADVAKAVQRILKNGQ